MWLNSSEGFQRINELATDKTPFLCIISYDKTKIFAQPLDSLEDNIYYKIEELRNYMPKKRSKTFMFSKFPVDFDVYKKTLDMVQEEIRSGNTYLLNLTFKTPIKTDLSLHEIFTFANAKFKLYFKDEFVCFSPERFVEIKNDIIATYPMKGTRNNFV